MKKKPTIYLAFLFVFTMAFSFGIASKAHADICCPVLGCPGAQGHWDSQLHACVKNFTSSCDLNGICS